jgi:adenosylcobyric acid synthase
LDLGIATCWIDQVRDLIDAQVIILPGSKNTLSDLQWLWSTGLASAILEAHQHGVPIVGICGGYQMLGQVLRDRQGVAGNAGEIRGLGLLPMRTEFMEVKQVRQVTAIYQTEQHTDRWNAYEIHMGITEPINNLDQSPPMQPFLQIDDAGTRRDEGWQSDRVWGTYLHGIFESPQVRQSLVQLAKIANYQPAKILWQAHQQQLYNSMADLIETHLDLSAVCRYLA